MDEKDYEDVNADSIEASDKMYFLIKASACSVWLPCVIGNRTNMFAVMIALALILTEMTGSHETDFWKAFQNQTILHWCKDWLQIREDSGLCHPSTWVYQDLHLDTKSTHTANCTRST